MTLHNQISNKDERTWGMLCHISSLVGFIIPLGNILGPLIIWLIKKDEYPFVEDQGKESLNFQITILLAYIVSVILAFIFIGFFLAIAVFIFALIMVILATVKSNEGYYYRYPITIRFIK